jgi:predicted unusual protein kinase regulating ubiquinone biosynthesis (AarF/ABC1/UbiB family)
MTNSRDDLPSDARADDERNRFAARATRYARVGAQMGGVAARMAGAKLTGAGPASNAAALASALGGLKGPLMKVAQLMSTIPDLLPPAYAEELQKLQSEAPPMGAAFVKRRMIAELGADWRGKFAEFDLRPAGAASLGQVHRAAARDGAPLACKLQYPDMASAVEADLRQLDLLFALHRRMDGAIDTREIKHEIAERVREELDYRREARHAALYAAMLARTPQVRVPSVRAELSTARLLTMDWLEGEKVLAFKQAPQEERNAIAEAMFRAWWLPFIRYGVIHGDPHLGNYSVFRGADGAPAGLNLYDFGCVRIFPPSFVAGVVDLYEGLRTNDAARVEAAYVNWGFKGLTPELIEIMNMWARFIYGPLLDDRVRTVADGVAPSEYGRREAYRVHMALKEKGPVAPPREFVFMDRAAVGLGGVFLHLDARLNFYRLFHEALEGFSVEALAARQAQALAAAGLRAPV